MPSNKTIIGVAVLLFGSVLLGVGMHHLVATGTCSSTGYSANLGPVPHCPKGTGWWILFLIGGIFMVVIGGLVTMSSTAALIIPGIFCGIGFGSMTVAFQGHPSSSTKTFALIFGAAFALAGLIPALFVIVGGLRKLGRSARPAPVHSMGSAATPQPASPFGGSTSEADAIMGAYTAGVSNAPIATAPVVATPGFSFSSPTPAVSASAGKGSGDAIDRIAKLAELRKSGALTEDEFNREKAKLLGEI